jgi:hypothetical protein
MAELGVLAQRIEQINDLHFAFSLVRYGASGDTFEAPAVPESAAVLGASGASAPTAAVASGDATVTLTGGNAGDYWIVTRHAGNPGGVNAAGVGQ